MGNQWPVFRSWWSRNKATWQTVIPPSGLSSILPIILMKRARLWFSLSEQRGVRHDVIQNIFFLHFLQIQSFFRNFGKISCSSLYKGSSGIDENLGYELETVLNSTFYYEMHSMNTRRCATSRFNDSSSDAKIHKNWQTIP